MENQNDSILTSSHFEIPIFTNGAGRRPLNGYNVTELIFWFGNITKFDTDFRPIYRFDSLDDDDGDDGDDDNNNNNNRTIIDIFRDPRYAQSLKMFAAAAAITFAIIVSILLLYCAANYALRKCASVYRKRSKKSETKNYCCNSTIILVAIFGVLIVFSLGFLTEIILRNSANDICRSTASVSERARSIRFDVDRVIDHVNNVSEHQLKSLLHEISSIAIVVDNDPQQQFPINISQELAQYLSLAMQIDNEIRDGQKIFRQKIEQQTRLNDTIDRLEEIDRRCSKTVHFVDRVYIAAMVTAAAVMALFCLTIFTCGPEDNCGGTFRSTICIAGFVMMTAAAATATATFITLIIGADFCRESKSLIANYLEAPMITDYYLVCDGKIANITNRTSIINDSFAGNVSQSLFSEKNVTNEENIDQFFARVDDLFDESKRLVTQIGQSAERIRDAVCEGAQSANNKNNNNNNNNNNNFTIDNRDTIKTPTTKIITTSMNESADFCAHLQQIKLITIGVDHGQRRSISQDLTRIIETVHHARSAANCTQVTPIVDRTLTTLCTDIYEGIALFCLNSIVTVFLYFVSIICTISLRFNRSRGPRQFQGSDQDLYSSNDFEPYLSSTRVLPSTPNEFDNHNDVDEDDDDKNRTRNREDNFLNEFSLFAKPGKKRKTKLRPISPISCASNQTRMTTVL